MNLEMLNDQVIAKMSNEDLNVLIENLNDALGRARTERHVRKEVQLAEKIDGELDFTICQEMSFSAAVRVLATFYKNPNTKMTCTMGGAKTNIFDRSSLSKLRPVLAHLPTTRYLVFSIKSPRKEEILVHMRRSSFNKINVSFNKDLI